MFDFITPNKESSKLLYLASMRQTQMGLFNPIWVKGLTTTCIAPNEEF